MARVWNAQLGQWVETGATPVAPKAGGIAATQATPPGSDGTEAFWRNTLGANFDPMAFAQASGATAAAPQQAASATGGLGGVLSGVGNFLTGSSSLGMLGPLAAGALGGLALSGDDNDLSSMLFGGGTARSQQTPIVPQYLDSALSGLMPQAAAGVPPPQFDQRDFIAPINSSQRQGYQQLGDLGRSGLGDFTMGAQGALEGLAQGQGANAGAFDAGLGTAQQYAQGNIPQQPGYRTGVNTLTGVSRGVPGSAQAQGTLGTLAGGGGVNSYGARTGQRGLTDTAAGSNLYGGAGFNAAIDAATRKIMPAVGSAFGGSGRLRSGLAQTALGTGIADAFASQYGAERQLQQGAQGALLNQQNIDRARQIQAASNQGSLANQTAGVQASAANSLLGNNADLARLGLAGADLATTAALNSRAQQLQAAGMAPQFEALRGLPAERLMQAGDYRQGLGTAQAQANRDALLTNNQLAQADLAARSGNVAALAGRTPIGMEETREYPNNPLAGLLGLGSLLGGAGQGGGLTDGLGNLVSGVGDAFGSVSDAINGLTGGFAGLTGSLQSIVDPVLNGITGGVPGLPFNTNTPPGAFDLTGNPADIGGGAGGGGAPGAPTGAPTGGVFNPVSFGGANVVPIADQVIGGVTGGLPGVTFNTGTAPGAFDFPATIGGNAPQTTPGGFEFPSAPRAPAQTPPTSSGAPTSPPTSNPLSAVTLQPGGAVNTVPGTAEFTGSGGGAAFNPASLTGATLTPIANSTIAGITGGLPGATFNAGAVPGAFELTGSLGAGTGTGGAGGAGAAAGEGALGGLGLGGALGFAAPALAFATASMASAAERGAANNIASRWQGTIDSAISAGRNSARVEHMGRTYNIDVSDPANYRNGNWFKTTDGDWVGINSDADTSLTRADAPPTVTSDPQVAERPSYVQATGQTDAQGTPVAALQQGQAFTPWQQGLPFARPGETMEEYRARMASSAYGGGGSGSGGGN